MQYDLRILLRWKIETTSMRGAASANLNGRDPYQTTTERHVEIFHLTAANKKNSKEIDISTSGVMTTLICKRNSRPNKNFSKSTINKRKNKDSKTI